MNSKRLSASRRSLRSVEKLLGKHTNPILIHHGQFALTIVNSAFVLSVAHLTGWSAHRIQAKVLEMTGRSLPTERIWMYHVNWATRRGLTCQRPEIRDDEVDVMLWLLKKVGNIELTVKGKPLFLTPKPIEVSFSPEWKAWHEHNDGKSLCLGFDWNSRMQTMQHLRKTQHLEAFKEASPLELPVFKLFGEPVAGFMQSALREFMEAVKQQLRSDNLRLSLEVEHREATIQTYDTILITHLEALHKKYQEVYGKTVYSAREIVNEAITINDPGIGAITLMTEILYDRWDVIYRLVKKQGVEWLCYKTFEADSFTNKPQDCEICYNSLGEMAGPVDHRLQIVVCCQKFYCKPCFKRWLTDINTELAPEKRKPPRHCGHCRAPFPQIFLDKIFDGQPPEDPTETVPGSPSYSIDFGDSGSEAETDRGDDIAGDEDVVVAEASPLVRSESPSPEPHDEDKVDNCVMEG